MGRVTIGVDVGSRQDHCAVAIAEAENRGGVEHYLVRQVQRLPLGTPYDESVPWIAEGVSVTRSIADGPVLLMVDATGVGLPVVDMLCASPSRPEPMPVFFTAGDRVLVTGEPDAGIRELGKKKQTKPGDIKVSIGKGALVSRVQALLNNGRLVMLRDDPAVAEMVEELLVYEIKPSGDANDLYGAFEVGAHDDLVTALGLAVHLEMWTREWIKWRKLAREFARSRRRRRGPIRWESVPGVTDWGKPAADERARSSVYEPPKR